MTKVCADFFFEEKNWSGNKVEMIKIKTPAEKSK
jgi:hypothetical protein